MQRIITDKKDTIPNIVEKILESPETEIVLVVPLSSALKNSLADVQLLKREAEAADKRISLETVDKEVLALAKKARLEAVHPLFKDEGAGRSLSDIVPVGKTSDLSLQSPARRITGGSKKKKMDAAEEPPPESESEEPNRAAEERTEIREEREEARDEEPRTRKISFRKLKIFAITAAVFLLLGGAVWGAGAVFGKAEVAISFKKVPWQEQETFSGDKITAKIDADKRLFPLEVFRQNKNITRLFPASGKAQVNQKATGRITIYNRYSASSQLLVASTRFMAPDGKIFRLDSQTVVPGATVQDGKVVPSAVEANVTADKAGEEYNIIGPVERLTIPGFKGTPRYEGFYGAFLGQTSGGSAGQKPAPTEQDIASAKEKTSESLRMYLENASLNSRPEGFKILPGASEVNITKLNVNKITDKNGNFGVFGEASFRALGFRESDMQEILKALAEKEYPRMEFKNLKINYGAVKPNFEKGQLSFSLSAEAALEPQFSSDELRSNIKGLGVNDAKRIILALPDLSSAKISLWPFWLYNLPTDAKKINVVVD